MNVETGETIRIDEMGSLYSREWQEIMKGAATDKL